MSKIVRMAGCPKCQEEGRDRGNNNLGVYSDGHEYCFAGHGLIKKSGRGVDKSNQVCYPIPKVYTSVPLRYTIEEPSINTSINTSTNTSTYLPSNLDNKNNKMVNSNNNSILLSHTSFSRQVVPWRGLSEKALRFYGAFTRVSETGVPYAIEFKFGGTHQVRDREAKNFRVEGDSTTVALFGMEKFSAGSSKAITITEGAIDAVSVYEMFGCKYPAVSVRSASSAATDCAKARDYLNSFERIYLCFDNDKPGQEAVKEVARLFDVNKVYHVKLSKFKDPNEYLQNKASDEFIKAWWAARPYLPKGIVADYDSIGEILSTEDGGSIATYPFQTLDSMAYGIRSGEVVLLTAQEKIGKTEIVRAIESHLLKTTDYNIGIIHLEEKEKRSIEGLISYEVGKPCHLPDCGLSTEDKLNAYKALTRHDGRLHFYTHFGSDDPDVILDVIRSLVSVCKCKFIFLDHITMLVTGFEGDDERRKLDYISTRLAMLTRELDFTLFLVSHVNDDGKTRGSRNIAKIADLLLHLDRDIEHDDADVRNTTKLLVKGNRFASTSGPAGSLVFDPSTYTIAEKEKDIEGGIDKPF